MAPKQVWDEELSTNWFSGGRITAIIVSVVLLGLLVLSGNIFESLDADEIMVVQSPLAGTLTWATTGGTKWQGFGRATHYPKQSFYPFEVPIRFNDGGHAIMKGSIQFEMPLDIENLTKLHTRFGSIDAIQHQLVEPIVNKSVYMTGPLMSSKQSSAESRNELIWDIEDQVKDGVYRTNQRDERIDDPITGVKKTVTVVELKRGPDGKPERQEEAILPTFGIKPFNFSITKLDYDQEVEKQIQQQQQLAMDVQTAMASARRAEQNKLTTEREGEASAAKAKWEQEAIKARAVTEAQQQKEVAETEAQKKLSVAKTAAEEAGQYKLAKDLQAAADSNYKKQIIEADGALQAKLMTYQAVMAEWAKAFAQHQGPLVPSVIFGQSGTNASSSANTMIDLLASKAAKDLALDLGVHK